MSAAVQSATILALSDESRFCVLRPRTLDAIQTVVTPEGLQSGTLDVAVDVDREASKFLARALIGGRRIELTISVDERRWSTSGWLVSRQAGQADFDSDSMVEHLSFRLTGPVMLTNAMVRARTERALAAVRDLQDEIFLGRLMPSPAPARRRRQDRTEAESQPERLIDLGGE